MLIVNRQRCLALGMLLLIALCSSCEEGPKQFSKGIRVWSLYDVVDRPPAQPIFLTTLPQHAVTIAGVGHFGDLQSTIGPPSGVSGSDVSFSGETNNFGFDDHESIRDNAFWDLSVSYVPAAIPGCGSKRSPFPFNVPQGGLQIYAICFIGAR